MKQLMALFHRNKNSEQRQKPQKKWHRPDRWLLGVVIVLSLFGILMVYDSSVAIALRDFGDQYYFVREQAKWLVLGLVACFILMRTDYHVLHIFALPLLVGTLVLLAGVFIPGIGIHALGARRWINMGVFVIQPAELAKLTLIIYLSAWFSFKESKRFVGFMLLVAVLVGLVVLEPDLGTSIILTGIAVLMYFFSGARVYHFFLLIGKFPQFYF